MPSRPRTTEFSEQAALLGQKVRAARLELGLSQLQLASELGMSYRQIQNIETNSNNQKSSPEAPQPANPKLDTVYLLAKVLQVDIAYLVDPSREVDPAHQP